jgi:hypothetical protein
MRKGFLALILGTAVAASAWTVAAQSTAITVVAPGVVTVKAEGVPLGDLLKQLSTLVAMDRLKIAPAALGVPVTVDAERVPVAEAMFLVLKADAVTAPVVIGNAENRGKSEVDATAAAMMASSGGAGGDASNSATASDETADQFGFLVGAEVVEFKLIEDSAVVTTPGFVPYKLRPEVVARRKAIDVGKIP